MLNMLYLQEMNFMTKFCDFQILSLFPRHISNRTVKSMLCLNIRPRSSAFSANFSSSTTLSEAMATRQERALPPKVEPC